MEPAALRSGVPAGLTRYAKAYLYVIVSYRWKVVKGICRGNRRANPVARASPS